MLVFETAYCYIFKWTLSYTFLPSVLKYMFSMQVTVAIKKISYATDIKELVLDEAQLKIIFI